MVRVCDLFGQQQTVGTGWGHLVRGYQRYELGQKEQKKKGNE